MSSIVRTVKIVDPSVAQGFRTIDLADLVIAVTSVLDGLNADVAVTVEDVATQAAAKIVADQAAADKAAAEAAAAAVQAAANEQAARDAQAAALAQEALDEQARVEQRAAIAAQAASTGDGPATVVAEPTAVAETTDTHLPDAAGGLQAPIEPTVAVAENSQAVDAPAA